MGCRVHRIQQLQLTGPEHVGSVVVAHGLTCSVACGIFLDEGPNLCPFRWQEDSYSLRQQGSPRLEGPRMAPPDSMAINNSSSCYTQIDVGV